MTATITSMRDPGVLSSRCHCLKETAGGLSHRHAGTAMLETVLVLPLVFVILGLIFFFGTAFEREQQQRILARYDVTRVSNQVTPLAPASEVGLDGQQAAMNELFFEGRGDFVSVDKDGFMGRGARSAMAGVFSTPQVEDLMASIINRAHHGSSIKLVVDFTRSNSIFEAINGPVTHHSTHLGPSWAYADAMEEVMDVNRITPPLVTNWVYARGKRPLRAETGVRDVYYSDFNRQLDSFGEPATQMVRLIRGMLYANQPGYRGPTVHFTR